MPDRTVRLHLTYGEDAVTDRFSHQKRVGVVLTTVLTRLRLCDADADGWVLRQPDGRVLSPLERLCDVGLEDGDALAVVRVKD